jgi:hypothetical protein
MRTALFAKRKYTPILLIVKRLFMKLNVSVEGCRDI